jgi:hypothetical protein
MQMVADVDADVRLEAAQRLGPDDLIRLRGDSDSRVRHHVAGRIGLAELATMYGDVDPLVQDAVHRRLLAEMMRPGRSV